MIRRLIVPLSVAVVALHTGQGFAQGTFPAPLPDKTGAASDSAFPPVNGAAPASSSLPAAGATPFTSSPFASAPPSQAGAVDECRSGFTPLRDEAEMRGKLIKAASDRHAPPDEACKLIENFGQAEIKMIKYVETHSSQCGIPPQVMEQLKTGHKNTETMQQRVCAVAQQAQRRAPAGPVGDFDVIR